MTKKRLVACMIGGALSALICVTGGYFRGVLAGITLPALAGSLFNRLLIGFTIGISQWRAHFLVHGAVIGLLVSLVSSLGFLAHDVLTFVLYTTAGVFYGVLTEVLATLVFKAPMRSGGSAS
jgi:hypothetical protein